MVKRIKMRNRFTEEAKFYKDRKGSKTKKKSRVLRGDLKEAKKENKPLEVSSKVPEVRIKASEVSCENFAKYFHQKEKAWKKQKKRQKLKNESDECNGDLKLADTKAQVTKKETKISSPYKREKDTNTSLLHEGKKAKGNFSPYKIKRDTDTSFSHSAKKDTGPFLSHKKKRNTDTSFSYHSKNNTDTSSPQKKKRDRDTPLSFKTKNDTDTYSPQKKKRDRDTPLSFKAKNDTDTSSPQKKKRDRHTPLSFKVKNDTDTSSSQKKKRDRDTPLSFKAKNDTDTSSPQKKKRNAVSSSLHRNEKCTKISTKEDVREAEESKPKSPMMAQHRMGKETISTCEGAKRLHDAMSARLTSSRFRYLNERLYSITSREAEELFCKDSEAYDVYHEGYKQQVKRWPMNPQDVFIKQLRKLPTTTVIADLGCGNAGIGKALSQHKVLSYDLVATDPMVTQCDMASIPLKSSSVDVAIFCLSLMGVNLDDFIYEANRILKVGGDLKIAEVVSRFDNVKLFSRAIEKYGFELEGQSIQSRMFIFFHFKKERNPKRGRLPTLKLKPCLYKKR